ncbi:MAG: response regulator, partial [Oceanococcaceae bacterium]
SEDAEATSPELEAPLPKALGWPAVRVLLAEDSPTNQLVFQAMLRDSGYVVDVVGNGREAVEAIQRFPYDVILMDVFMPEMDGVEATRQIRKARQRSELPIIALTANAMQGDRERFMEAGMNEHLTKPLERQTLLAALYRWMAPRYEELIPHEQEKETHA